MQTKILLNWGFLDTLGFTHSFTILPLLLFLITTAHGDKSLYDTICISLFVSSTFLLAQNNCILFEGPIPYFSRLMRINNKQTLKLLINPSGFCIRVLHCFNACVPTSIGLYLISFFVCSWRCMDPSYAVINLTLNSHPTFFIFSLLQFKSFLYSKFL